MKRESKQIILIKIIAIMLLSVFLPTGCKNSVDPGSESATTKPNGMKESPDDRGAQIVADYLKADAAPFRKSRLRFTVISETDPPSVSEIDLWRKQTESETLTLSHIIKPVEDNELSSLADEVKDKETVITTFVLSTNQFRETGANKALFGGIPAQELLGEWSKYSYQYTGEKDLNGVKVLAVEGKLNPVKRSLIAKMTAYFQTDTHLPAEIHLFDATGKEMRTFRVKNYQTNEGHTFVSNMEIENNIYKTRVAVEVLSMSFPDQMDEAIFTREQLKKNAGK